MRHRICYTQTMLAGTILFLSLLAGAVRAESGPPCPQQCQRPFKPNVQNFGYFRTTWRQWPGEARPEQTNPRAVGAEPLPTPQGQEELPLPKPATPKTPTKLPEIETAPLPLGTILPPEGTLPPAKPEERGATPKAEQPSPGTEGILPGLPPEPGPLQPAPRKGEKAPSPPLSLKTPAAAGNAEKEKPAVPAESNPHQAAPPSEAKPQEEAKGELKPKEEAIKEEPKKEEPKKAEAKEEETKQGETPKLPDLPPLSELPKAGDAPTQQPEPKETPKLPDQPAPKDTPKMPEEPQRKAAAPLPPTLDLGLQPAVPVGRPHEIAAAVATFSAREAAPRQVLAVSGGIHPERHPSLAGTYRADSIDATVRRPSAGQVVPTDCEIAEPRAPEQPHVEPVVDQRPVELAVAARRDEPIAEERTVVLPPVALGGYCPVELVRNGRWVPGDVRWTVVHKGWIYRLSGTEQRQQFISDPDGFTPVNSGNDPVLSVDQRLTVPGLPTYCATYRGRLYMFSSAATQEEFNRSPHRYTAER